ncbi:MAG: STAS domain-containing protein [Solobacterium sp.]|nr:STAS domain-containing protein [Solobacterium sp.]
MLNITKTMDGSKAVYNLEGRLDTITAPDLEKSLGDELGGVKELVLDMEKLEYISSAGLRVLLSTQKVMAKQGEMKLIHVNDVVMEIFEVTGFTDILTIE